MTIPNGCIFDNAVAPLFPVMCTGTQLVPSTKVQTSSVTANTVLMTNQLTGGLYIGP